ncbi:hypothetical protein GGF46_000419 [Coemansia sp. RSA 552]|nr:hypothetical protein GGF46_000419 [Coemansia sp. RSA 552]
MGGGWVQSLSRLDAFQKTDSSCQARTSSGGFLSVVMILTMLLMAGSEIRDYLRYQQTHLFGIDTDVQQPLQINFGITVAMPCGLVRVDLLDVSGNRKNLGSKISTRVVSHSRAFEGLGSNGAGAGLAEMHVHDIIADAGRRRRRVPGPQAKDADSIGSISDAACYVEGSAMVNKVKGLFHITAYGHAYGGAYIPNRMMNFTHYIDELSYGPLYPSLDNPLDGTLHIAQDHNAAFNYFVSVIPTTYIGADGRQLKTNQYAVNEYYKTLSAFSDLEGKPPGIFLEYSFEPIAVTVREHRGSVIAFVVRLCSAVSGLFVTAGIAHRLFVCFMEAVSGRRAVTTTGILDLKRSAGPVPGTSETA